MIESAMVAWSGGASAKNDALAVLSRLLDGARRSRFIDYNPAREVKRPSMRESISPVSRALTLEQITTMLELIPDGVYRRYFAALVFTGIRAGEATALRVAIGKPDLRIHDLRHTFATILFDAGASAPDVQATLGHSSLQVTERYSRAREGVALRAGAALNEAIRADGLKPSGDRGMAHEDAPARR